MQKATFAAGCFWGVQEEFDKLDGVEQTRVGYCGGDDRHPTYKKVCSGTTGHAEAIEIIFDENVISYDKLLNVFFHLHDPTQKDRQGPDVGSQYRSAIFYHDEKQKRLANEYIKGHQDRFTKGIVTEVEKAEEFYEAEPYHQKYYQKGGF